MSNAAEYRRASTNVLPPLTTHWTRPQSCTWTYVADGQTQPASPGAVAWLDLEPIPGASTLSCYPDGMFFEGRTGVFSPATCPDGWTTVSLRVNTDDRLIQAITTAVCCSYDYTFDGKHCRRLVPTVLAVPITYDRRAGTYKAMPTPTTTLYSATIAVNTIRALFREQDRKLHGVADAGNMTENEVHGHSLLLGAVIFFGVAVLVGTVVFCLLCW
ncbi:hypothetical protein HIM_10927 [Hirsutella minnesotensis 3608]|uniref:Uncharacterized protein n=1 Tax=Hirsutella minnesotensis 3608 TaxID=1043627 RepID=A0A0F7ZJJ2_9HYPO|nr:hypothetical protein HIM_10927 [Hirsutella minnesotensis 3608]